MIDWKLLCKITLQWVAGSIGIIAGFSLLAVGGAKFHDWAKPIDGYVIAGSILMWILYYSISDSYKKACKKRDQKTIAEIHNRLAGMEIDDELKRTE